jgi:hypothetical protein
MTAINIDSLLENIKSIKAPRYKIINGKRIKNDEYLSLDEFEREELELKELNLNELDEELNELNKKWDEEMNPIRKEILKIKYFLVLEQWEGFEEIKDPRLISRLSFELNKLEQLLNPQGSQ